MSKNITIETAVAPSLDNLTTEDIPTLVEALRKLSLQLDTKAVRAKNGATEYADLDDEDRDYMVEFFTFERDRVLGIAKRLGDTKAISYKSARKTKGSKNTAKKTGTKKTAKKTGTVDGTAMVAKALEEFLA
jgi:hypothetical protein